MLACSRAAVGGAGWAQLGPASEPLPAPSAGPALAALPGAAGSAGPLPAGESQDGASEDGESEDGASEDGESEDGALEDGESEDGALEDGESEDGALEDGKSEPSLPLFDSDVMAVLLPAVQPGPPRCRLLPSDLSAGRREPGTGGSATERGWRGGGRLLWLH